MPGEKVNKIFWPLRPEVLLSSVYSGYETWKDSADERLSTMADFEKQF